MALSFLRALRIPLLLTILCTVRSALTIADDTNTDWFQVEPQLAPPLGGVTDGPAEQLSDVPPDYLPRLPSAEPNDWNSTKPVVVDGGPQPSDPFSDDQVPSDLDDPSRMTWVVGGRDGLGWFGLEEQGVLGYWGPEGFADNLGYSIHFLEGPRMADLPPRLYGLHYGMRWRNLVTEHMGFEVAVAPGVYSDFEDSAREGIRIQGHGFAMWTFDALQFVLGVDYLDRDTVKLLPIAGVVWAPDEATRFELVFPRPRLARLVGRNDARDHWFYVSAEYGGDSWAIERTVSGLADVVTLNETRIAFGAETVGLSGHSSVFEIALHVDRELVYRTGDGDFHPTNTVAFRWGSRF